MNRNALLGVALGAALVIALAVGFAVNRAGDARIEELLVGADRLATGEDAQLDDIESVRGDIASGLGDALCSERVIRLTERLLPERWRFNDADLANLESGGRLAQIRLADARNPDTTKTLDC